MSLTPKASRLVGALREALDPLGESGRTVTRGELRKVVSAALALIGAVFVDVLD